MKWNPISPDDILQYLQGHLSKDDQEAFEKRLSNDAELRQQLAHYQALHNITEDQNTIAFQQKVQEVRASMIAKPKNKPRLSSPLYVKIAAVVVAVIGISVFLYQLVMPDGQQYHELYTEYYTPFVAEGAYRTADTTLYQSLVAHYKKEAYDQVIQAYQQLPKEGIPEIIHIYIGNSYLQVDAYQKAIQVFTSIPGTSLYYETALWYQALAFIKLEQQEQALQTLKALIVYNGSYQKQAKELLKKVEILSLPLRPE